MKKEMEIQEKNLREIETKTREKLNELRTHHEEDLRSLESDHTSKVSRLVLPSSHSLTLTSVRFVVCSNSSQRKSEITSR
jgi:hypothetical protein